MKGKQQKAGYPDHDREYFFSSFFTWSNFPWKAVSSLPHF
jgi:hypothetical protein